MSSMVEGKRPMVVLVTGGTGLVGKAIEHVVGLENNPEETWVFAGSKDGDLRDREQTRAMFAKYKPTHCIHVRAWARGRTPWATMHNRSLAPNPAPLSSPPPPQHWLCAQLAAMVGGLFKNLKYKVEFYRENILINDNVMECCKEMQVRRARACLSLRCTPMRPQHPPLPPSTLR